MEPTVAQVLLRALFDAQQEVDRLRQRIRELEEPPARSNGVQTPIPQEIPR